MSDDRSRSRSRSRAGDGTELWFDLPSFDTDHQPEQSAYRTTSSRLSMGSTTSVASQTPMSVPAISTMPDFNKSLPLPPSDAERKSRRQTTLRSFLRGRSTSNHLDPSHLQPEPSSHHQRHLSVGAHLSVDVHGHYQQQYSRSMPNSPHGHRQESISTYPPPLGRVRSANPAFQDTTHYLPYVAPQEYAPRPSSPGAPFDLSPTRARTFPDTTISSPTARNSVSNRPRPHTWLSPTEPFADPSQFHLFVEATTGLPDDSDPWSPNGPNRLQSSLFARRPSNGSTPVASQYIPAPIPDRTHQTASWQSFEPPLTSSRSVSAPMPSAIRQNTFHTYHSNLTPHMNAINAELEMLGLDGDSPNDDELPDYAQSQAEMNEKKRVEASARARELEARWRGARSSRS
ncbi:hypothetical protein C7974DRAFT_100942 [Boeremia exigua]|uniref:uncharacterized protein n=1 Tax=Boeremia exigua TaxID=749465 RepID=UPI001E8D83BD|nr:uncharacterized protein C7974DRAFT_100942 [Boeremia exigua]KAH6642390.1 hypothetical protein C7974DRAFT_100942 [Boeremia exigua]